MPPLIRQVGIIGALVAVVFVTVSVLLYLVFGLIPDSWLLILGRIALAVGVAAPITIAVFMAAEWLILGGEPKQSKQPGHAR